jgi:tRNA (mo5U34)-methyltransferase
LDVEELRREVAAIQWFQSIDLGHGIVTPGVDRSARRLKALQLPARLDGQSVLDIGTWNGFYAFAAEQRGASRVLATDSAVWREPGIGRAGFDLAHRALNSGVEGREIDVLELSPDTVGEFDVVLFLGVLYHLRHPLLALERVASVTKRHLVLETAVDMLWCGRPAAAFYPGDELKGDASNWWGPNPAATVAMLRDVGFSEVRVVDVTSLPERMARAAKARSNAGTAIRTLGQGRAVFHAFK